MVRRVVSHVAPCAVPLLCLKSQRTFPLVAVFEYQTVLKVTVPDVLISNWVLKVTVLHSSVESSKETSKVSMFPPVFLEIGDIKSERSRGKVAEAGHQYSFPLAPLASPPSHKSAEPVISAQVCHSKSPVVVSRVRISSSAAASTILRSASTTVLSASDPSVTSSSRSADISVPALFGSESVIVPAPSVTVTSLAVPVIPANTGSVVPSPIGICPFAATPSGVIAPVPEPSSMPPSVKDVAPVPPSATVSVSQVISTVSVPAVPVITRGLVSVIVKVSVADSATGSVPAGTSIVSKVFSVVPLPPPPPVIVTVAVSPVTTADTPAPV